MAEKVKISGREIAVQKSIVAPRFDARNVLTTNPWTFVDLWLKREGKTDAAFYWEQARQFHAAHSGLPMQSSPLLLYYSFMNAAKALLASKNVSFDPYHGVAAPKGGSPRRKISLGGEVVEIKSKGVLPSLSQYFGEVESSKQHTVEDMLYNMSFVHRTYAHTYTSKMDMFVPLKDCEYVRDSGSGDVFFRARLSKDFAWSKVKRWLPPEVVADPSGDGWIRSARPITWSTSKPQKADLDALVAHHRELRNSLQYINGTHTLWYLKTMRSGRIERRQPTLILAVMHRLSEMCRYRPIELASYMKGQRNWLLSEFVSSAATQFVDSVAAEITGYQILVPNVRAPT